MVFEQPAKSVPAVELPGAKQCRVRASGRGCTTCHVRWRLLRVLLPESARRGYADAR